MPFRIVRNDIANMRADAIVNSANPEAKVGMGVDSALHRKAGPELLEFRRLIGNIPVGEAAATPAFSLKARYVIHAVAPVWRGGDFREAELLRGCYERALRLAVELKCESVAIPLLGAGTYGFPKALALQIAIGVFSAFLMEHDMQITLVVYNRKAVALSERLVASVTSYIDENYIRERPYEEEDQIVRRRRDSAQCRPRHPASVFYDGPLFSAASPAETAVGKAEKVDDRSLEELLTQLDTGFSETLLKLIDQSGKTDPEVYKKANIDKKLFSKIRSNPDYRPKMKTALAFAIALELDIETTRDLLARAGLTLSRSRKFDVIVEYFITHKRYDIFELNQVLFAFHQPLIGG